MFLESYFKLKEPLALVQSGLLKIVKYLGAAEKVRGALATHQQSEDVYGYFELQLIKQMMCLWLAQKMILNDNTSRFDAKKNTDMLKKACTFFFNFLVKVKNVSNIRVFQQALNIQICQCHVVAITTDKPVSFALLKH